MKKILKYILLGVCGALIIACIVCAFIAGQKSRKDILCRRINIVVADSLENRFISPDKIKKDIKKEYGNVIGLPLDSIDLQKIEKIVDNQTAVFKSQAYTTKDSTLNIEIKQRKPIVRFQKGEAGFYADNEGYIFPLQTSFTSHVLIVDGNLPINMSEGLAGEITRNKEWFLKTIALINYIESDSEWKKAIVQININKDGDIVMVPREGQEKFVFGQPEEIEHKFEKLKKYYTAIVPKAGRETYKVIDLRFKEQIVCK